MNNLEYLEKVKHKDNERKKCLKLFPEQVSEWEIEYRRTKASEIIAECMIKQNEMAESAIKKTQELYEANMAMIKERLKKSHAYQTLKSKDIIFK